MPDFADDNLTPDHRLDPHDRLMAAALSDALGLLSTEEAALFERDFHAAPDLVRMKIISLQANIAGDPAFGSDEEPSAALRERVVDAVMREVDESFAELGPLAIIGREGPTPVRRGLFSGGSFWRAASLALAAASVTSLVFVFQALESNRQLRQEIEGSNWQLPLRDFPELRSVVLTAQHHRALLPATTEYSSCTAVACVNAEKGTVAVFGFGFKGRDTYTVQVLDGETLLSEQSLLFGSHGISGAVVTCASEHLPLLASATIRIVDGAGNVVLA